MKFKTIQKVAHGSHLHYYRIAYENRLGNEKVYEMISRDGNLRREEDICGGDSEAVVLIVFNEDYSKILLNKEFRMAVNNYIYNVPAGLVEKGETLENAAARELKEETGLDVKLIVDILPPAYSSVGISNEKSSCVICIATGEIGGNPEPDEEIECAWFSKEEIRKMINEGFNFKNYAENKGVYMAARTQMLCYLWAFDFFKGRLGEA